ncbi:MAG: BRO family protein [Rikenellaceae bacterium]|uniref:BRO family protein n=1 Tax=Chakrabartyella piscis TaxID=2918914 RepID=UPI00295853A9|nr:BRO family protein [Chakrabartyella piscis]
MEELQIFKNDEFGEIRTITIDGNPWFVGKDVAEILGYVRTDNAIRKHVDDEDKLTHQFGASGQLRQMVIINESGLYSLALKSKLPSAKAFKRWVTSIVIPSIRKYGGYVTEETLANIFRDPEHLHTFLAQMLKVSEENRKLKQEVGELQTKGEYFDKMMDAGLLINFRTTAKEIGVKPMFLIHFMLENKYLYRNTKKALLPYQHHVEDGLFEIVEFCKYGHSGVQTLVTTTGRNHFLQLYLDGEMEVGEI